MSGAAAEEETKEAERRAEELERLDSVEMTSSFTRSADNMALSKANVSFDAESAEWDDVRKRRESKHRKKKKQSGALSSLRVWASNTAGKNNTSEWHESCDLDGDGIVGAKDRYFASMFDRKGDRKLGRQELKDARQALESNYPPAFQTDPHPMWTKIERAVWINDLQQVRDVLEHGDDDEQIDAALHSVTMVAVLMAACQSGSLDIVQWVAKYRPRFDERNGRNQTAMHMAAEAHHWEIVKWLYDHTVAEVDEEVMRYASHDAQNLDVVKWLMLNAGITLDGDKFQAALMLALDANQYYMAGFLFGMKHNTISVKRFADMLFKLGAEYTRTTLNFDHEQFYEEVKAGYEHNDLKLHGALKISHLFSRLSEKYHSLRGDYQQMAENFTRRAIWLWESLQSDVLASCVLEEKPQDGIDGTVLEVALASGNVRFVGHPRVNRIVRKWWQPIPLSKSYVFQSPSDLFRTPVIKFYLDGASFLAFLLLASYYVTLRVAINDNIQTIEWVLLVYALSFLVNEVQQLWSAGAEAYWAEGWNKFDMLMITFSGIIVFCRTPDWTASEVDIVEPVYLGTVAIAIITMWIRSMFLMSQLPALGPLLLTLRRMGVDIVNFGLLQVIILVGFCFAFFFVLDPQSTSTQEPVEGFDDLRATLFTLFQSGMAGEPLQDFGDTDNARKRLAELLASIYIVVSGIVLVNLLIAMMGHTFQSVKDNSDAQYLFSRMEALWKYDQSENDLPAPFNLLVILIVIAFWSVHKIIGCCRTLGESAIAGTFVSRRKQLYCFHCHQEWMDGKPVERLAYTAEEQFPSLANFDFDKVDEANVDHALVAKLYERGLVCSCVRLRNVVSGDRYFFERVGMYIFALCLWLPVVSVVFVLSNALAAARWVLRPCSTRSNKSSAASSGDDGTRDRRGSASSPMSPSSSKFEFKKKRQSARPLHAFADVKVPNLDVVDEEDKIDDVLELVKKLVAANSHCRKLGKQSSFRG